MTEPQELSEKRLAEIREITDGWMRQAQPGSLLANMAELSRTLLAEVERLREREAALLAVARELAEIDPIGESGYGDLYCMYCNGDQYQRDAQGNIIGKHDPGYDPQKHFGHETDCPVIQARALLASSEER